VLVYGAPGAGKTTMAEAISRATGLPWHPVDDLTWEPGWVQVPLEEQRRRISEICAGEEWILDAAYGPWLEIPLARADLIVALDYPRWLSLQRLVRRTVSRAVRRTEVCNGNRESLRMALSKESIVIWHFRSVAKRRRRMQEWACQAEGPAVLRFTRARDANQWVAGLGP
jgi:adenylate kinase family enzyme